VSVELLGFNLLLSSILTRNYGAHVPSDDPVYVVNMVGARLIA